MEAVGMPLRGRRRAVFAALTLLAGLIAALALIGWPGADPDRTVTTRATRSPDPFQHAVLMLHNTSNLVSNPLQYFRPPYLYPDPNPLSATEPFIAQAVEFALLRLMLPGRPILAYSIYRLLCIVLLVTSSTLLLRSLGLRPSLALAGGVLPAVISTSVLFAERLQPLHLHWYVLALLCALKVWQGRGRLWGVGFAVTSFMALQSSVYTDVFLLAAAPFVVGLLVQSLRSLVLARRTAILALLGIFAALLSAAALWPWMQNRSEMRSLARPDFIEPGMSLKPAHLDNALRAPAEFEPAALNGPAGVAPFGYFPGWFLIYMGAAAAALAIFNRRAGSAETTVSDGQDQKASLVFRLARVTAVGSGLALAAIAALAIAGVGWGWPAGPVTDSLIWLMLISWNVRLALWPRLPASRDGALHLASSGALLLATVMYLFSLGSPLPFLLGEQTAGEGITSLAATFILPLRAVREFHRFLVPAGVALVFAIAFALQRRTEGRSSAFVAAVLAPAVLLLAAERSSIVLHDVDCHPVTDGYRLLKVSRGVGGLLELPLRRWGHPHAVRRMFWQPGHGRPIVDGFVGPMPPWRFYADSVLNEFPSEESLLLLRAWSVDTVLTEDFSTWRAELAAFPPPGVEFKGRIADWQLFDIHPAGQSGRLRFSLPQARWVEPIWFARTAEGLGTLILATDGSLARDSAARLQPNQQFEFAIAHGYTLAGIEINWGYGVRFRIPRELKVYAWLDGEWKRVDAHQSGRFIHARAADRLLRREDSLVNILVERCEATLFRIASDNDVWHLPQIRLAVVRLQ